MHYVLNTYYLLFNLIRTETLRILLLIVAHWLEGGTIGRDDLVRL